ncbi:hypothetical protein EVG20_g3585 [Dentipellis fragilis]|uniref:RNase III domain-containing protein n=1 Tax=Dentipellis fragilis TaxID=205917 RepID=A0A4Y9Z314_9AGAM|nr:hypothetical protein EVG20_g3585 [Dentipellis fragilis]
MGRVKLPKATLQDSILNDVIIAICSDDFDIQLPDIHHRTWATILTADGGPAEYQNERLEYIGDALMYFCVALELFERYPTASPGFMTKIRQPLVTNLIFSLLAEKIDGRAARKGSVLRPVIALKTHASQVTGKQARGEVSQTAVKAAADTLEMVVGALYIEKGLLAVRQWVSCTFELLIETAVQAYDKCHHTSHEPATGLKRWREDRDEPGLESSGSRPTKRPRVGLRVPTTTATDRHEPRSASTARGVVSEKIIIDLTSDSSDMEMSEEEDHDADEMSDGPVVIDLTISDDEDENHNTPNPETLAAETRPSSSRIRKRDAPPAVRCRTVTREHIGHPQSTKHANVYIKNLSARTTHAHGSSSTSQTIAFSTESVSDDDKIPGLHFANRSLLRSRAYSIETSDSSSDS